MSKERSRRPALNPTAATLLGFLHLGAMSGWDLIALAERTVGDYWTLTRSQVYRELATLSRWELVVAGEPEQRERRVYHITDDGRAAFAAWIDQEPGPEQIRYPLLLTIGFGQHLEPARLAAFIEIHRRCHEERLASYGETRESTSLNRYQRATLDFGLRYERAVIEWFEHLPELLSEEIPTVDPGERDSC